MVLITWPAFFLDLGMQKYWKAKSGCVRHLVVKPNAIAQLQASLRHVR